MNVPNILTIARFGLTVVFIWLFQQEGAYAKAAAACVFATAAITDFFDGYIARKYNLKSDFGAIADPIADKFLTLSAFYLFAQLAFFPLWMFVVIAGREIILTLLRFWGMFLGAVIAADTWGKYKTTLQMVVIILMLIKAASYQCSFWTEEIYKNVHNGILILMYATVFLTVYSGLVQIMKNRKAYLGK